MFKVYYKNTWTTSVAYRSSVFIFNFEHISYLFLLFEQMLAWLLFFPIDESKETRNQSGICIWCKTCKKVVSDLLTYLVLICCVKLFLLWSVAIRNIFSLFYVHYVIVLFLLVFFIFILFCKSIVALPKARKNRLIWIYF